MITTARNLPTLIKSCFDAGVVPCILGPAGAGKSAIVAQVHASMYKPEQQNVFWRDIRLSMYEPTDIVGIPMPTKEGRTSYLPPNDFPRVGQVGTMFFDEITNCALSMLHATYQLVLDRRVGSYVMPEGINVVMAGNRPKDKSGAIMLPPPLRNRVMFIELAFCVSDWVLWAHQNNIDPILIGFGQWAEEHDKGVQEKDRIWCGDEPPKERLAFMTPRSLTRCHKIINSKLPADLRRIALAGMIGEKESGCLQAYIEVFSKLPKLSEIVAAPMTTLIPDQIDSKFAVGAVCAGGATVSNFGPIVKYLSRLGAPEIEANSITTAVRKDAKIATHPEYVAWALKNKEVFV